MEFLFIIPLFEIEMQRYSELLKESRKIRINWIGWYSVRYVIILAFCFWLEVRVLLYV